MTPHCRTFAYRTLLLLAGLLPAGGAHAGSVDVSQALGDFNAVIFGDSTTPSDIEGAAVIGGNFAGATMYFNPPASLPAGFGALTVYGSTSGSINLNDGGSAFVGGTKGATINFNGGGGYLATPPGATIGDFQSAFVSLSATLSALTANSLLPVANNNEIITATPNAAGIAVFNVTAGDLASIPSYSLNLNGAKTVIFNVSGTSITFNGNNQSGTAGADKVIWNFYQANAVTLGTQLAGTALAVNANVTNGNQIDGDLIAQRFTGNGELHDYGFTGLLPNDPVGGVPEISTWAMALIGLAALGLVGRRRATKVA